MHKQRGMTFLGVVLMIAGIVFVAVIGMKLTPAYIEYFSVKKAIARIANDPDFKQMSRNEMVASFDRTATIDNITVVKGSDLIVERSATGMPVVIMEYQTVVPLVANVSALLDFSASSDAAATAIDE